MDVLGWRHVEADNFPYEDRVRRSDFRLSSIPVHDFDRNAGREGIEVLLLPLLTWQVAGGKEKPPSRPIQALGFAVFGRDDLTGILPLRVAETGGESENQVKNFCHDAALIFIAKITSEPRGSIRYAHG